MTPDASDGSVVPSRRRVLVSGLAALSAPVVGSVASTVAGGLVQPASASTVRPRRGVAGGGPKRHRDPKPTTHVVRHPGGTKPAPTGGLPSDLERHYLNRLGCGWSPTTYAQLRTAGSAAAWLRAQLAPATVEESSAAAALPSWFPDMDDSPTTKWSKNADGTKGGWEYAEDFASYSMLRQVYSSRQVLENLVMFWSNHLHVNADHDTAWVYRKSYDDTIRAHALGTFEELLVACSLHPAMLLYLDTWTSVRGAPNENQGRELLELHTVGRDSGYTEAMVKDSAKILSGYTVDTYKTWAASYNPAKHTTGAVSVLGFSRANADADGSAMTVDYLKYLAHHPATATRIATKLCQHFVTDQPSAALVAAVAKAFTDSGTDIKTTLRALVAHPDFAASAGTRVRNPVEDFVATCRVLGVKAEKPTGDDSFARACIWVPQTTLLYQWPRPDGLPLADAPWSSATRMLNSFSMHWQLAAGWWPTKDVTYRKHGTDWWPAGKTTMKLSAWVDHLSRLVLGKAADDRTVRAVVDATAYPAATVLDTQHQVVGWMHVRVMGALLDSPDHMSR